MDYRKEYEKWLFHTLSGSSDHNIIPPHNYIILAPSVSVQNFLL